MEMTGTTAAAPCGRCGTHEGYRNPRTGEPHRTRKLCEACYIRERRAGRLDRWPKRRRTVHLVAHDCAQCGATFHDYAARHRAYCSHRCLYAAMRGERHPTIPTGIVTPQMLGIAPGQPPTDPGCTPARVYLIGNTNVNRATHWLVGHGWSIRDAIATSIWEPASTEGSRVAA